MTTNVALQILEAQDIECLRCGDVGKVKDFARWVTDRAGLTVVYCACPICCGRFRRIICA